MPFNSFTFLVFFAVVLAIYSLPLSWKARKIHLLISSYLFYAAWNPPFVALIWLSTAIDWLAAHRIARARDQRTRRAFLAVSLLTNLGLLGIFKYGDFLLGNFTALAALAGIDYRPPQFDIVLPVGISFYTFQTLSYTFGVYRREHPPWTSLLDFSLFVTFFPQLVAGPIVRAQAFLPQCSEPNRATANQMGWGMTLLAIGLFEKIVLSDALAAPVVDTVYGKPALADFSSAWIGTMAFSAQIFFDFAGYSTAAIGIALCFGFCLPDNFRFPYAAIGFTDFWRRWHISLSTWLRDYLYISLGGNRRGTRRTYVNLMLTMLIGGLWHGASWLFVAWGGLHGLYLVVERWLRERFPAVRWAKRAPAQWAFALGTYAAVCVAWVFFRAQTFGDAVTLLSAMFGAAGDAPGFPEQWLELRTVVLLTAGLLLGHWLMRATTLSDAWSRTPAWLRVAALVGMLCAIAIAPGDERAFIYFQF